MVIKVKRLVLKPIVKREFSTLVQDAQVPVRPRIVNSGMSGPLQAIPICGDSGLLHSAEERALYLTPEVLRYICRPLRVDTGLRNHVASCVYMANISVTETELHVGQVLTI